jgi:hypothetical protein
VDGLLCSSAWQQRRRCLPIDCGGPRLTRRTMFQSFEEISRLAPCRNG